MSKSKIAKAGQFLSVDEGAYSDYGICGFFIVQRDFDPAEELVKYLDANQEERKTNNFQSERYLKMLLKNGLLMEIDYGTIFLGEYGGYKEFRFTPPDVDD
jgi:hypothetical protein